MSPKDQPPPSHRFTASAMSSRPRGTSQLISIRLPEDLLERLAVVGNEEGLSMSDTIRLVLERGLTARSTTKKGKQ